MSRFRPLALAALAGALLLAACSRGPAPSADDMTLGDPNAPVKMVEYASASCTYCATFNNEVFPTFKEKYIDTGNVHYTLKELLTPPNELAAAAFLTARCAGKERYFTVLDAVFRSQQEIFQTGDMRGVLLRIAQSAGLTEAQFNACITDEETASPSARARSPSRPSKRPWRKPPGRRRREVRCSSRGSSSPVSSPSSMRRNCASNPGSRALSGRMAAGSPTSWKPCAG